MSPLNFGLGKTTKSVNSADLAVQYGRFFSFEYQFTDGSDLDTRTGFIYPAIGSAPSNTLYEGYSKTGNDFLHWGGDNTGTGYESCYIDKDQVFVSYPGISYIEVDLRCHWYANSGLNPVVIKTNAYAGGVMVKQGYQWTNPTATYSFPAVYSVGKVITSNRSVSNGERVARVKIDFNNFTLTYYQD